MVKLNVSSSNTSEYGIIEDGLLLYKGTYYTITFVGKDTLFVDSTELFGKVGDEFPIAKIRTKKTV